MINLGFFGLINLIISSPYLVFRTEFVIVFIGNPFFEKRLLNLSINFIADFCPYLEM